MNHLHETEVKKVYIVFKTHLDIGFTDFSRVVKQQYFESFIPAAMRVARQLRERGGQERFVWTTGSWLIYEYLEVTRGRRRKEMEEAIGLGDIAWHGLPFTTQSELQDAGLFRYGLALSRRLDQRFGRQTIAAKMTDVPGHTRAIVPLLAEAGIRFLHIGVNGASTAPDVPDVFVWQQDVGNRVIVMYDKSGYGAIGYVPGMSSALALAHTNDNMGPNNPDEIVQTYTALQKTFPQAELVAARLDDYAAELITHQDQLPVVTNEIGDTWIHGAGTDPLKVAQYRELCRLRNHWLQTGRVKEDDKRLDRFNRLLMVVPEHTWGMDEKTHLDDYEHYDAAGLRSLRRTAKCKRFESSWAEQRDYVNQAVDALGAGLLQREAAAALQALRPARPSRKGMRKITDTSGIIATPTFDIGFNQTGALQLLRLRDKRRAWASAQHTLGQFTYQTYAADDYERFGRQYVQGWPDALDWAIKDFTKPGMEKTGVKHATYMPSLAGIYQRSYEDKECLLLELRMPAEPVRRYGCPASLTVEITLPHDRPALDCTLQWFNKQACRLPESLWFAFNPGVTHPNGWTIDKMGVPVSPLDVVRNGNRHLHAAWRGVRYQVGSDTLRVDSWDAPLVAPGGPALLDFNNRQPQLKQGMHFNLYNNIWGTNFPMWYDEDASFRFSLSFGE